jgi:hypothetical protein
VNVPEGCHIALFAYPDEATAQGMCSITEDTFVAAVMVIGPNGYVSEPVAHLVLPRAFLHMYAPAIMH